MKLTAGNLTHEHIGKTATFIVPGYESAPTTGEIYQISHLAEVTEILIPYTISAALPHNTPITIQEGQ